ncbi:lipid IV(A) 3-deoxy-D-manno-octulosonic acid transferase [Candidatus Thioglobus sp.]
MNRTLYSLVGYLLLPILIIRLLVRSIKAPKYRQRIFERLGLIDSIPVPIIWIHCVSVGEFRASIALIDVLIKNYPNHRILVSSTTPTGSSAIKQHYSGEVLHLYFPFDLNFIVRRYINKIKPELCLLMETEIWPNLIHSLQKNNIPSILINARMSQKSMQKYQKFAPKLVKQTLDKLTLIAAQNQNSAQRFVDLGADNNQVIVAGNIKFDQNPAVDKTLVKQIQSLIGKRKVVVFASTHKDEEQAIMKAYLKNPFAALMLIVPRHPERFNEVFELAQKNALSVYKRSHNKLNADCQMLLGDSMGEMMAYFDLADIVFMGGSLVKTGGHNMLEPAALSKPILFGPNVFNFSEISSDLLALEASIQVQNAEDLLQTIGQLLTDDKKTKTLGKNANQYFKSKQGAVDNITKQIKLVLQP